MNGFPSITNKGQPNGTTNLLEPDVPKNVRFNARCRVNEPTIQVVKTHPNFGDHDRLRYGMQIQTRK